MSIVWKHLLKEFLKVFILSIFIFISLLLVIRGQEIARFATLQSDIALVLSFLIYQIPYILPLAIPISVLISSYLLIQKLSLSFELTSLRASGLSAYNILFPLYVTAFGLCFINFFIVSEISPQSRLKTILLPYLSAKNNPLILLKKSKFIDIKDSYIDLSLSDHESKAKNLILVMKDDKQNKLTLTLAEKLRLEKGRLIAENVSHISSLHKKNTFEFDDVLIENIKEYSGLAQYISSFFLKPLTNVNFEHLTTKNCLIKKKLDHSRRSDIHCYLELYRRFFSFLSPFTFMIIGLCFGLSIGRTVTKGRLYYALALSIIILVCFMGGKSIKTFPSIALSLYLIPQLGCIFVCFLRFNKILKGG